MRLDMSLTTTLVFGSMRRRIVKKVLLPLDLNNFDGEDSSVRYRGKCVSDFSFI